LTDVLRVQSAGPNENHRKLIQLPNRDFGARDRAPDLKLYKLLSHFTNLTVRHHEVVALVPEDKDAGRVSLIKGPEFRNEPKAEFGQSPDLESERDDHKPKNDSIIPALEAEIMSPEIQPEDDEIIGLFFLKTREFIDNRDIRELPFEQHAHILVHLLQKNHAAKLNHEFVATRHRLAVYIFLASGGKMLSRFYNGMAKKGGKNLWSVLSREITGVEHGANDILDYHLSVDVPSDDERRIIRLILDYWLNEGVINQEEVDQLDIRTGTRPFYDREGRQRFQKILHLCMTQALKSLENLERAKKSPSRKVKKEGGNMLEIAEDLEGFAVGAINAIRNLSIFRKTFKNKIVLHLSWLAKISDVNSTIAKGNKKYASQNREFESSSSPSTSAVPSSDLKQPSSDPGHPVSDPAAMSHTAASEPHTSIPLIHIPSSDIASSDVPEPSPEMVIEDFRDMGVDQASNEDADEDMELEDLVHQKDGWEAATEKYMELICLHYQAFSILSAKRKPDTYMRYVGKLIQKVNLCTVHVEPENNDQTMIKIPLFLENFNIEPGRELSQVECDYIKEWLIANTKARHWQNGLDSDIFFGTWHCECLLMSLHLLSSADPGDLHLSPDAALAEKDHHLHLPDSDVLQN